MIREDFPGCCNAFILHGFGNAPHAQAMRYGDDANPSEQEQLEWLSEQVERYGSRMLVATTNNQQTVTNRILKSLGFKRTKALSKRRHPDTKLILWWREPDI